MSLEIYSYKNVQSGDVTLSCDEDKFEDEISFGFVSKSTVILHDAELLTPRPAQQQPVAWRVRRNDGSYELYFHKPNAERAAECYIKKPPVEPLYTSPQPSKPLPEIVLRQLYCNSANYVEFFNAYRAAHGITGEPR